MFYKFFYLGVSIYGKLRTKRENVPSRELKVLC